MFVIFDVPACVEVLVKLGLVWTGGGPSGCAKEVPITVRLQVHRVRTSALFSHVSSHHNRGHIYLRKGSVTSTVNACGGTGMFIPLPSPSSITVS